MSATRPLVTVLYEDSMEAGPGGSVRFRLHDLLLRCLEDDINGTTHHLSKQIHKNARNGVDKVLQDLRLCASLIAGPGSVFALLDRDRIHEHLHRQKMVKDKDDAKKMSDNDLSLLIAAQSNAPSQVKVFFLHRNLEDLITDASACGPAIAPDAARSAQQHKSHIHREVFFDALRKATHQAARQCLRQKQPGWDALVKALQAVLPPPPSTPPTGDAETPCATT